MRSSKLSKQSIDANTLAGRFWEGGYVVRPTYLLVETSRRCLFADVSDQQFIIITQERKIRCRESEF